MTRLLTLITIALSLLVACGEGFLSTSAPPQQRQQFQFDDFELDLTQPEGAEGPPVFAVDVSKWAAEVTDAEVACWYDDGVRHVIVGTQNHRVTRQQLEEALEGGMSVDAYIYLYWNDDWSERVKADLELLEDYPIGRYWLDVEDKPGNMTISQMEAKIQEGLDACGDQPCGIYTAGWWWKPHMQNRDTFKDIPLWHAYYDEDPSLATWDTQKFGGWDRPWGKQWVETYFCGPRLDKNTMFINAEPIASPKTFVESAELPAPTDLYPKDGMRIVRDFVRVLSDTVPGADNYDFAIESYSNGRWTPYYTFGSTIPAFELTPGLKNRMYRFRVRAHRGAEASPWSYWSYFADGVVSEMPEIPATSDPEEPQPEEPQPEEPQPEEPQPEEPQPEEPQPEEPQPEPGAPTNLSPADASALPNGAVTMSCDPIPDATNYAFEIEFRNAAGAWAAYYTYRDSTPTRTFYPQPDKAYRWRVISVTTGGETASDWTTFTVGSGTLP